MQARYVAVKLFQASPGCYNPSLGFDRKQWYMPL